MSFRPAPVRLRTLAIGLVALPALALPGVADARLGDQTLRKGDSGKEVRTLQRELTDAGYAIHVDGEYGRGTAKKVKSFERDEDLKVDGKLSPTDADKLADAADATDNGDGGGSFDESASGSDPTPSTPAAPGSKATVGDDGLAVAPADAPQEVKDVIEAGNDIAHKPYVWGGGHGTRLKARGYDCSGSISYALRRAGLMEQPLASGPMMRWGKAGKGTWITIRANSGHAYMTVAGLRFDTSAAKGGGSRWTDKQRSAIGYTTRHPNGF